VSRPVQPDPVESLLAGYVEQGWMPGAVWWVEGPNGPLSRGALGHATTLPAPERARISTPYDLASLTKMLVTAPLLVLMDQDGVLSLDAPVGGFVPELSGSDYAEASLRELASHTARLPAWSPLYVGAGSMEGYVRKIADLPPAVRPGATLYSDLGFILLGAVIERVSGIGLDPLFAKRIALPLGLRRTGYAGVPELFADAAATELGNGYERNLAGDPRASHDWRTQLLRGEVHDANAHGLGGVAGHAGLFGVAEEVAKIARAFLRLIPVPGTEGRTVGLVVAAHSTAARGALPDTAVGHTGFTGTSLWLDPSAGRIFLLLTNRVHPTVEERDFQTVRREFHRVAASLPG